MKEPGTWDVTDLSSADAEAPVPQVPEGITSAASFACLETLGVLPPLDEGWLPRSSGQEKEQEPMWWANIDDPEWIYNGVEDKYFHLPTRSLWEKRDLVSQDPKAPPYTYFRLDAVHLQALRHFASSVDSNLVPMVWKAWMRLVMKERRASKDPTRRGSKSARIGSKSARREAADSTEGTAMQCMQTLQRPPPVPGPNPQPVSAAGPSGTGGGTPFLLGAQAPEAATLKEAEKPPSADAPTVSVVAEAAKSHLHGKEAQTTPSKRPRKKSFCFCVFARFGHSEGEEAELLAPTTEPGKLLPTSDRTPSTSAGSSAASQARSAKDGTHVAKGSDAPTEAVPTKKEETPVININQALKAVSETAELHMRRLEQFLAEVKKNPQRLVTHVEKRRTEKTGMAFLVTQP